MEPDGRGEADYIVTGADQGYSEGKSTTDPAGPMQQRGRTESYPAAEV